MNKGLITSFDVQYSTCRVESLKQILGVSDLELVDLGESPLHVDATESEALVSFRVLRRLDADRKRRLIMLLTEPEPRSSDGDGPNPDRSAR